MKKCSCCKKEFNPSQWEGLLFKGTIIDELNDGTIINLECRNCDKCDSTLAIKEGEEYEE